jgi:hypothetical protein
MLTETPTLVAATAVVMTNTAAAIAISNRFMLNHLDVISRTAHYEYVLGTQFFCAAAHVAWRNIVKYGKNPLRI